MRRLPICLALSGLLLAQSTSEIAGKFTGEWTSANSGSGGAIHLTLKPGASSPADAEVSFGYEGQDVKTKVKTLKIVGGKIDISYEFDIDGNQLVSILSGTATKEKLEGKYQTKVVPDGSGVDSGKFTATLVN